nr:MarR family transcriptional regulator [Aeromicrobium sp. CFBP 8757]
MNDDLNREHGLTHTEYLVLMHLSESRDGRIAVSDLAGDCHQSVSAVSRTIGRLEQEGLIRREPCTSDGRSVRAVLTADGLVRLQAAWPTHLRSVRVNFLDHLAGIDIELLAGAFTAMARGADPP